MPSGAAARVETLRARDSTSARARSRSSRASRAPAVVTDAPKANAWMRLCYLNLHHNFDLVITYDDTRERKPARAPFMAALDGLGLAPAEVLMVGDWPERDMVGARNVGIRTVFARYGDTFDTVRSGADFEIDDIFQLVEIVDRLNAAPAGAPAESAARGQ